MLGWHLHADYQCTCSYTVQTTQPCMSKKRDTIMGEGAMHVLWSDGEGEVKLNVRGNLGNKLCDC